MCTGSTWFQVAPTVRYELDGVTPDTVSGKDIFLHIANEYGDAVNLNLEFGGSGVTSIPMHDRRTIATHGTEVSTDFSIFEADDVLTSSLDDRGVTGSVRHLEHTQFPGRMAAPRRRSTWPHRRPSPLGVHPDTSPTRGA